MGRSRRQWPGPRWAAAGLVACLLALPRPAGADLGDLDLGLRLQWAGGSRAGAAALGHLGLGDQWAGTLEVGGEAALSGPSAWRLRAVAGPTWMLDVLRWVPAATLAAGVEVDAQGGAHLAALARAEIRYFLGRHLFVHASAAARWGANRLMPELGAGVAWQM